MFSSGKSVPYMSASFGRYTCFSVWNGTVAKPSGNSLLHGGFGIKHPAGIDAAELLSEWFEAPPDISEEGVSEYVSVPALLSPGPEEGAVVPAPFILTP